MPDDRLIVGGAYDPSDFNRGIASQIAVIEDFERQVKDLAKNLPSIDSQQVLGGFVRGMDDGLARMREFQREATRMRESTAGVAAAMAAASAVTRASQASSPFPPFGGGGPSGPVGPVNAMTAAMAQANSGTAKFAEGLRNLSQTNEVVAEKFGHADHAGRLLRSTLVALAAESLETNHKLVRLAEVAVLVSGGQAAVVGIATAIIAAAKAWDIFKASEVEATKVHEALLKSFQTRVQGATVGNEAAQRGAARRELDFAEAEGRRIALAKEFALAQGGIPVLIELEVLQLVNANKQAALRKQLAEDTARAENVINQAREQGIRTALQGELAIARARVAGEQEATRARLALAQATGRPTFGAQPGGLSEEERRNFAEQIDQIKERAAAERAEAIDRRTSEQRTLDLMMRSGSESEAQLEVQRQRVEAINRELPLIQMRADLDAQGVRDERARLEAERQAAIEQAAHLQRIAALGAGAGNRFGGDPRLAVTLPTPEDVRRLDAELSGIKTILLPTQDQIKAAFEEARRGVIAPILQGGREATGPNAGATGRTAGDLTQDQIERTRTLVGVEQELAAQLAQAALQAGNLDQGLARVVTSGLGLGTAVTALVRARQAMADATDEAGRLAAGLAEISSIGGIISAGIGIVGGIVGAFSGGNPNEAAQLQLLGENNQRLAELRAALDENIRSAGTLAATMAQLQQVQDILTGAPGQATREQGPFVNAPGQDPLSVALREAGITLQEFGAQVQQLTGLSILDEHGQLVARSFDQVRERIAEMEKAATHFSTTVEARERQARDRARIFGIQGNDIGANRAALLGGLDLDTLFGAGFEQRIASLDLSTAEGQKAYRDFLQQLYGLAAQGKITADVLGDFANVDDVVDKAAEGADAVAKAQQEAADKIREAAEKQAQAVAEFASSLQGLRDARARLAGDDDPSSAFKRAFETLVDQAPVIAQQVAKGFGGFGTIDDPETQRAIRDRLLGIIDQIQAGFLSAADLGITPEQLGPFIQFLDNAADSLDNLAQQAEEAARNARDQMRAVGDLRDRIEQSSLPATSDPAEQHKRAIQAASDRFTRELDVLRDIVPNIVAQFDDLDLTDPAIAQEFRDRLLAVLDQVGDISPEVRDEVENLLGIGADVLDQFNESVQEATKSMTNVPQGLNLAEFEWRARLAGTTPPGRARGGDGSLLPGLMLDGVGETVKRSGDRQATLLERILDALEGDQGSGDLVTVLGQLVDTLRAGRSGRDIAGSAREQFRRDGMATTGSPDAWPP